MSDTVTNLQKAKDVVDTAAASPSMPHMDLTSYPSQIFWLSISFVVLYFIIARVALPRISEIVQSRQDRISGDLDRAEMLKQDAEKIEAEYRASLENIRAKSAEIISKANQEVEDFSAARHAELDEELAKKSADAEKKILAAKKNATAEVESAAADIAILIAGKTAGLEISSNQASNAVKKIIDAT